MPDCLASMSILTCLLIYQTLFWPSVSDSDVPGRPAICDPLLYLNDVYVFIKSIDDTLD